VVAVGVEVVQTRTIGPPSRWCAASSDAMFLALTWHMHYRKQEGRWLISVQRLDWQFLTPLDAGWVKVPMAV
jgi:hypothetical protein